MLCFGAYTWSAVSDKEDFISPLPQHPTFPFLVAGRMPDTIIYSKISKEKILPDKWFYRREALEYRFSNSDKKFPKESLPVGYVSF